MPKSLEQNIQHHREQIVMSLDAASNWRSKNDSGAELSCLYSALKDSLCVAVSDYDNPQTGIEYLKTEIKPIIFARTFELIREFHINGSISPQTLHAPGLSSLALTVHAAWILDLFAEAKELASVCEDKNQICFYQSDALWRDYARGLAAVAHSRQFEPQNKKYTGYDRHWATYLQLMANICVGNDVSAAIATIDQSFSQRNRDKRLINDGLDGDGTFPVRWDFRKHSLMQVAKYNTA